MTKMKHIVLSVLIVACLLALTSAEAKRKTKKYHKDSKNINDLGGGKQPIEGEPADGFEVIDPCDGKCSSGQICQVSEGEAMCICIPNCPEELDPRRKVCSSLNSTWNSDCSLHQMRCWCRGGDPKCDGDSKLLSHFHIEYYGECRQHEDCTVDQMADFPRRMRDWLFNVMRDMADRNELSSHFLKMEQEAETNLTRRWTNAAVWKFCDLDKSNDRSISRHEIFPIRAPLVALEHCIAPFLDKCDADSNHRISLPEWASCLEIDQDDIEDRCEDVRGDEEEEE